MNLVRPIDNVSLSDNITDSCASKVISGHGQGSAKTVDITNPHADISYVSKILKLGIKVRRLKTL